MAVKIFLMVSVIGCMRVKLHSKIGWIDDQSLCLIITFNLYAFLSNQTEEVFSGKTALWLSPDGSKLAYARFDDTTVRRMLIPIYGIAGAPDFQYPADLPVNYPKVRQKLIPKPPYRNFNYLPVVTVRFV